MNNFNRKKIIETFLLEIFNRKNRLNQPGLDSESEEFEREGMATPRSEDGRGAELSKQTVSNVDNTDVGSITAPTKFSRIKQWVQTMKNNNRDSERRRRVWNQVLTNKDDPAIIGVGNGNKKLIAGNTRATLRAALGLPIKAHVTRLPRT